MIFTRLKYKDKNIKGTTGTLFLKPWYSLLYGLLALRMRLYVIYTKWSFPSTARLMRCSKSRFFSILDLSEQLESGLSFLSTRQEASKNEERRKIQLFVVVYFKNSGTS